MLLTYLHSKYINYTHILILILVNLNDITKYKIIINR